MSKPQRAAAPGDKWQPYRHPQPKESPPELVVPNAIPTDERIWVPVEENVWFRPLLMCASRGYWMNLLKVKKSGVLSPTLSASSCGAPSRDPRSCFATTRRPKARACRRPPATGRR